MVFYHGAPLIRASRQELIEAGVESAARVSGVLSGKPQFEDGSNLPAEAVIWATGFRPDYRWIDLPVFDDHGYPRHRRGIVQDAPGLYFVGLHFQTALSSALLGGVGAEARHIVQQMV
jgi:putative flavoprotein involved in K+ transport